MAEMTVAATRWHGRKYFCGVPKSDCCGTLMQTSTGHLSGSAKIHGTSHEAFKCHAHYLVSLGYTQIGSREFAAPDNGPVRVLTKKSKFGHAMRPGKGGRCMQQYTGPMMVSM